MASPKYVIDPEEGGEKQAGERTINPFRWMIDGFSNIANRGAATHYSESFTACGFTWKLRLKSVLEEDGEKYVGLYLTLDDAASNSLTLYDEAASKNSVIKATCTLFIYDQLHAKHIQQGGEDYFHSTSHDEFCCKVALNKFNSSKSGLLVNDCCIFGAEVLEAFACKLDKKGIHESLSLKKDLTPRIYTWVIKDVSKSEDGQISEAFSAGGYNWRIMLFLNLFKDFLAIFLVMDKADELGSKTRVYVDFSFCLLDQHNAKHWKRSDKQFFSSKISYYGVRDFLSWNDAQDPSRGFLRNDTSIVEASVVVLGVDTIT